MVCRAVLCCVQVVKARGAAMAAAAAGAGGSSGSRPHGMLSVVGLSDEQLQQVGLSVGGVRW